MATFPLRNAVKPYWLSLRAVAQSPLARWSMPEGAVGHFVQPLALGKKPVLERRLLDGEPLQQIAPIESGRVRERQRGALRHLPLERDDVDCYGAGIERHRIAVGMEGPQRVERLTQARPPWSPPCCPRADLPACLGDGRGPAASPHRPRVLAPSVWERQGERRDRGGLESRPGASK